MEREEIEIRVKKALAKATNKEISEIIPGKSFKELGIESLFWAKMIWEIDEEFKIDIELGTGFEKIKNLKGLVDYVSKKI